MALTAAWLDRYLGKPVAPGGGGADRADLLAQVRRLEVRARKAMVAGLAGQYSSAFKGRGLEFEEVREYRAGDDVRTIDWNVTARTGRLHVKLYREERDLTLLLLADLSASTRFGSGVMTVHDVIAEVSGLFALAGARRDRVGAVLFDGALREVIPPRRGWRYGLGVVHRLLSAAPGTDGKSTAVAEAIGTAVRLLHRRGIVVLVIDGACPLPRRELAALAGRHEVVIVRVHDPLMAGLDLPAVLPVREAEGSGRGLVAGRRGFRKQPVPAGVDVVDVNTQEDYLPAIRDLLRRRERRRAR